MREKLQIPYPVIVEGKYDRQRLECVMVGKILTTDGFGIFKKAELLGLFKKLSEKTPLILLTDSDGAGKLIRSYITSAIPKDKLIQLYIPRIEGKEKRKSEPSAEGTLGVEGMEQALLYELLSRFADPEAVLQKREETPLSKTDLYLDGLTGKEDSRARRDELAKKIGLPPGMTPDALLSALRILLTYEEYLALVGRNA
ncbi:MAG: DUF4093 domain-containing protein [Clostridia bacterium]|nr:DUF4093 domain-containing protein [Clostridia bacterium]